MPQECVNEVAVPLSEPAEYAGEDLEHLFMILLLSS
jgi:hypothetical protein